MLITPLSSITPRDRPAHGGGDDPRRPPATLDTEEARQGDGRRENLRVMDVSLVLAVIALAVLGFAFAAASLS
jgi:hypothetical protein